MAQNKKIILFDIDYVLIDTSKLKEITSDEVVHLLGISKEEIKKVNEEFTQTLKSSLEFSPEKFVQFLINLYPQASPKSLASIYRNPQLYKMVTYPNVFPALKRLKGKASLGIFSEGIREFQMAKITLSGLISYFDQNLIFIYPDKIGKAGELVKKLGEIYFVDDNPRHIKDIATAQGTHPIWLKRGPKAETQETLNYPTILSLKELEETLILPDRQPRLTWSIANDTVSE